MRAHAQEQIRLAHSLAERVTKPHPEFASPQYVQNLQRTVRYLAKMLTAEIQSKVDLLAVMAEGADRE